MNKNTLIILVFDYEFHPSQKGMKIKSKQKT